MWWADSSMFKEGVLSGASGRMSGVLEGRIHGTFLALERKAKARSDVPSQNVMGE